MNHIEYLLEELEEKGMELREDIMDKPLSLTKAYAQGKLDAYNFVLETLKDGLKAEREEDERR